MTKVDHHISTSLLVDSDAYPHALKKLYMDAIGDYRVTNAVARVVAAHKELLDEAGLSSELQHAVLAAADESGDESLAILATLREREQAFLSLRDDARAAKRAWLAKCDARRKEVAPLLARVASEQLELVEKAKNLQQSIAGFERARKSNHEKLISAGLTDSEIAIIGLKPGPDDRVQWLADLERIRAREAQINAFQRSYDYDVTLLGDQEAGA